LVAGRNRVPRPATGKTAFLIFINPPWLRKCESVRQLFL
jgi:hypothetical protein